MIHYYKFKNFYSFANATEVSFILPKAAPENHLSFSAGNGTTRLSKIITAFGANGSGKTNLLRPLAFLSWFASQSFLSLQPEQNIPLLSHFAFSQNPAEFEVEFELNGKFYKYELKTTFITVLYEALSCKDGGKYSKYGYVFKRQLVQDKYEIKQKDFDFDPKEAEKVRKNASLISTAAQYNTKLALELKDYLDKCYSNIGVYGRLFSNVAHYLVTAELYEKDQKIKDKMLKLIKKIDLGLIDIEFEEQVTSIQTTDGQLQNQKRFIPYGIHESHGKRHRLHFAFESNGTQTAFSMLYYLLSVLENGSVAVIDELEQDFHPHLLEYVLNLFINPSSNPHNAQIIFTSHSPMIMNLLNKSNIMLIEKDEDCQSHAWKLDDISGVRNDDNWYAKYYAGAYGAVPNLE